MTKFLSTLALIALGFSHLAALAQSDAASVGKAKAEVEVETVAQASTGIKRQAQVDSEIAAIMQMLRDEGIDIDARMERARVLCRNRVMTDQSATDAKEIKRAIEKCAVVEEGVVYARAINEMNAARANAFDDATAQYNAEVAEAAREQSEFDRKQREYELEIQDHNAKVAEVERQKQQYARDKAAHEQLLAKGNFSAPAQSSQPAPQVAIAESAPEAQTPASSDAIVAQAAPPPPPSVATQQATRSASAETIAPKTVAQSTAPKPAPQVAKTQPVIATQPADNGPALSRGAGPQPTYGKMLSGNSGASVQEEVELAIMEATGPRIALVIGNEEYSGGMGSLANPVNDAVLIGATLRSLGFDVEILTDANQRGMKEAVQRLGTRLQEAGDNATGLFYYAGHGVQSKGQNFLVPVGSVIDAESDLELEAVKADAILAQMEEAYVSTRIVILDACRNMPLRRRTRNGSRGLARMETPNGSFVAYSTSPGSTAADGGGIHSPFAEALAKQMLIPDRPIEVTFREVRRQVVELTSGDQVPWNSSSLLDTFTFAKRR